MFRYLLIRLCCTLLLLSAAGAQAQPSGKATPDSTFIFRCFFEPMPEFPGGQDSLRRFIDSHLNYPEAELESGTEGRVVMRFRIHANGAIDSIQVEKGATADMDAAAIRLVRCMPRWIYRQKVPEDYVVFWCLPILFRLD